MTDAGEWAGAVSRRDFRRHPEALDETALSVVPGFLEDVRELARAYSVAGLQVDADARSSVDGAGRDVARAVLPTFGTIVVRLIAIVAPIVAVGVVFARSRVEDGIALPIVAVSLAVGALLSLIVVLPLRRSSPPTWGMMFVPGLTGAFGVVSILVLVLRSRAGAALPAVWWVVAVTATVLAATLAVAAFLTRSSVPGEELRRIDGGADALRATQRERHEAVTREWVGRLGAAWDARPPADRDRVRLALEAASRELARRGLIESEGAGAGHLPGLLILESRSLSLAGDARIDDSVAGLPPRA